MRRGGGIAHGVNRDLDLDLDLELDPGPGPVLDLPELEAKRWHTELSRQISDGGVGNIQGMGYGVFCNWMNGKKRGSKRINARAMKGMEHFVNDWEGKKKN